MERCAARVSLVGFPAQVAQGVQDVCLDTADVQTVPFGNLVTAIVSERLQL